MNKLSELSKMNLSQEAKDGMSFSNVYQVIKGGFDTDGIETYLSSVKIGWLTKDIEIFEKLTEDKSWPVSSIIQREIDDRRVKQIAEEYILKSSNNVKYFPPIIVAIVPRETNEHISKEFSILTDEDKTANEVLFEKGKFPVDLKEHFKSANNISRIDGFYVLDWLNSLGKFALSWDKEKIYAIVIDGQHRLEALKYSIDKKQNITNYLQDVVFLDISKKANKENRSPAEAIRRVFIDINYNAKPVSNARRTLMDDKDLSSLIVQSLVNDDDLNGDRVDKYLIPQIVDWHSDNLKHSFPQITGVLVLQQLIEDNFLEGNNITSLSDMRSKRKVNNFVNILKSKFLVDERISSKGKYQGINKLDSSYEEFKKQIDKQSNGGNDTDDKEDILFIMDYNVLNVARDTFEEIYSKNIIRLFNEFLPYKKAIKILDDNNVFNVEYNLNRTIIKNTSKLNSDQKNEINRLQEIMHNELDKDLYLTFTVLGQKAFFRHYYKELSKYTQSKKISESVVSDFTDIWLKKMNFVIDKLKSSKFFSEGQDFTISQELQQSHKITNKGLIASSFWQGIIYNEQNIIYNKQGIDGFVGVLNYLYKVNTDKSPNELPDEAVWDSIPYSKSRISRKIKQDYIELGESETNTLVDSIWSAKFGAINELIHKQFD